MAERSREWIEHSPDLAMCVRLHGEIKCDEFCSCGLKERHRHCKGCGRLLSIGDWGKPGVSLGIKIRIKDLS